MVSNPRTDGPLNAELGQFASQASAPAEIGDISATELAKVAESAVAAGLPVGATAPDFELVNADGEFVSLADRLTEGPVVVSFYRGAWCPFCNLELLALQRSLPEIRSRGASLIAISQQAPDRSAELVAEHILTFDVLSDTDGSVAKAWKVRFDISEEYQEVMEFFHVDLTQENANGSQTLVVPATFVIDQRGRIRDRYVSIDYTTRMEPVAIIEALDHCL